MWRVCSRFKCTRASCTEACGAKQRRVCSCVESFTSCACSGKALPHISTACISTAVSLLTCFVSSPLKKTQSHFRCVWRNSGVLNVSRVHRRSIHVQVPTSRRGRRGHAGPGRRCQRQLASRLPVRAHHRARRSRRDTSRGILGCSISLEVLHYKLNFLLAVVCTGW
jgi:hypothetical protein